jgi:hypothetical protein
MSNVNQEVENFANHIIQTAIRCGFTEEEAGHKVALSRDDIRRIFEGVEDHG